MTVGGGARVIICGGENTVHTAFVQQCLDRLHKKTEIILVIEDGTHGAASAAKQWARRVGVPVQSFERHGVNAPPTAELQNSLMIANSHPTHAIAFDGGDNVFDMIDKLQRNGLRIWTPTPPPAVDHGTAAMGRRGIVPEQEQLYEMAM